MTFTGNTCLMYLLSKLIHGHIRWSANENLTHVLFRQVVDEGSGGHSFACTGLHKSKNRNNGNRECERERHTERDTEKERDR